MCGMPVATLFINSSAVISCFCTFPTGFNTKGYAVELSIFQRPVIYRTQKFNLVAFLRLRLLQRDVMFGLAFR